MKLSTLAAAAQEKFPVLSAAVDSKIVAGQAAAGSVVAGSITFSESCNAEVGFSTFVTIADLGVMAGIAVSSIIFYLSFLQCRLVKDKIKTERLSQKSLKVKIKSIHYDED